MVVGVRFHRPSLRGPAQVDNTPLIADPDALEANFAVSPDGRWIAYVSNESGQRRVFVRPFPGVDGAKWPVSREPAFSPQWSPDGGELFYKTQIGQFMAAEIVPEPTFIIGERTALFDFRGMLTNNNHAEYDVHPDGDRFLMIQLDSSAEDKPLVVIEGFFEELRSGAGN